VRKNIRIPGRPKSKLGANGVSALIGLKRYCVRPFARGYKAYYFGSVLASAARDLFEDFGLEEHRC
jgi:hypothetical protein